MKRHRKDCRAVDTRVNDNRSLSESMDGYLEGNAAPGLCVCAHPEGSIKNFFLLFFFNFAIVLLRGASWIQPYTLLMSDLFAWLLSALADSVDEREFLMPTAPRPPSLSPCSMEPNSGSKSLTWTHWPRNARAVHCISAPCVNTKKTGTLQWNWLCVLSASADERFLRPKVNSSF